MKIGFDAKRVMQNFTGLGNYSRYVIESLYHHYPEHEYILYAPNPASSSRAKTFLERNARLQESCPEHGWKHFGSPWRVWGVTSQLERDGVDIFHGLSNELPLNIREAGNVRSVVSLHDLIFLRYPQYYHRIDRQIYAYKFRRACEQADRIIAISECTKQDIISFFGIPEERITVIYQGCDEAFAQCPPEQKRQEVKQKYALPDRYILNVGSIEERKNVLQAVKALPELPEEIHLVIVGRRTPYTAMVEEFVREHKLEKRVRILNSIPFADLPSIYRLAEVFVYPSRFEGFGIPILEAIHSGLPVVATTGSCLEEAGGPDALYVHPDDTGAMQEALSRLCADPDLRDTLATRSLRHAEKFSARQQATELMEVYKALSGRS